MTNTSAKFEPRPFGKYFLTQRVAIGGMAEIYKAKTFGVDGFEKTLAIKKILPHCSADKEFITMLTDEAKLVVNLSHTNIVQVYDLGRVGSDYFISMEFIDGVNLRQFMQKEREQNNNAGIDVYLYMMSEVCKGLDYAHSKRDSNGIPLEIVHRDVSPQNILVSFEGEVKIVDFGIAKAAMNMSQTNVGTLKGKVTYMSPEQALGKPIDGRTDIFSCGIILYELVTGKRLFVGETQLEILQKIRSTKITEEFFGQDVPDNLKPILAKALAYSPKNRYQNAADMQIDLTRLLYSNFHDFSPRKLSEIMSKWFRNEMRAAHIQPEDAQASHGDILVSSSPLKNPLVKNDPQVFIETLKPEDQVSPNDFEDSLVSPPVSEESVEPHQPQQQELSVSKKAAVSSLSQKNEGIFSKKSVRVGLIFVVLALGLLAFFFRESFLNQSKNTMAVTHINIDLTSQPTGAQIFLDDQDLSLTTPALITHLELNKTYKLKLVKPGYQVFSQDLVLTQALQSPLSYELQPEKKLNFTLTISSEPAGAQIFINNKDMQKITPADFTDLQQNQTYVISLQKEGFQKYQQDFLNTTEKDQILNVKLLASVVKKIAISSEPAGAKIFINQKDTGFKTPHDFTDVVYPQKWDVVLQKEKYKNAEQKIDIQSQDSKQYHFNLEDEAPRFSEVGVSVKTNVNEIDVFIDKKKVGVTPFETKLKPGNYYFVLAKDGYRQESKVVKITDEKPTRQLYFKMTATAPQKETVKPINKENSSSTPEKTNKSPPQKTEKAEDKNTKTPPNINEHAKLRIDSIPSGASVKINGRARGVTPIIVSKIKKQSTLVIKVSKKGHKTWEKNLSLNQDMTEINAVLSKE